MAESTVDRWFLSDCEGRLVIIREAKLRGVTRNEAGEITGYRLPTEWGPGVVIAEWDLNTWDAGDDETDDQYRATAARIIVDHNDAEQLRAELAQLAMQRNAVIDLAAREQNDAAADVQAGGPPAQLDDLTVPVHDLLIAVGVIDPEPEETNRA